MSAILEFRKSISLSGKNADVWFNLARVLYETKELEDAESAVQKALTFNPTSYLALSLLGKILHARGDHDRSIAPFHDASGLINSGQDLTVKEKMLDLQQSGGRKRTQIAYRRKYTE